MLIFKATSVLTRLWNLHASNEPGRPDVILLGASISACEKGRQWQHALSLLKDVIWLRKRKDSSGHRVKSFTLWSGFETEWYQKISWFWKCHTLKWHFRDWLLSLSQINAWLCYLKFDCGIWIEDFWIMQDSYLWNSTVLHFHQWGSLMHTFFWYLMCPAFLCCLSFLFEAQSSNLFPDTTSFNATLSAVGKSFYWEKVWRHALLVGKGW